jgi:hypothetical protein
MPNVPVLQVSVPSLGLHGFLDASDYDTWMKHVECAADKQQANVVNVLAAGQVSAQAFSASRSSGTLPFSFASPVRYSMR